MGEKGREGGGSRCSERASRDLPREEGSWHLDGEGGPDGGAVAPVPLLCTGAFPQNPLENLLEIETRSLLHNSPSVFP